MDLDAIARYLPLLFLVALRFFGLFFTAPAFLVMSAPLPVRFYLVSIIAFVVSEQIGGEIPEILLSGWLPIILASSRELLIGAGIGFIASAPFYALQISGRFIGTRMGLAMVSVLDPVSQEQQSIVGQLLLLVGLWFFFSWNGHIILIRALVESFKLVPIGGLTPWLLSDMTLTSWLGDVFIMAFKIAMPFYGALLLADVGLGFVARTVPQMNVFILGLPLKIGLGLFLLMVLLPMIVDMLHMQIEPYLEKALMSVTAWF